MRYLENITKHRATGAVVCLFGVAAMLFWLPNDVDSGLVEKVRRRYQIGDMLAPAMALSVMLAGGVWLVLSGDRATVGRIAAPARAIAMFLGLVGASLLLMRFAGPAAVWIAEAAGLVEAGTGYRPLRDTLPWKFIGFLAGGTMMIWALSAYTDNVWSWRRLGIGFLVALAIGAAFDLPFEDLILPPNGDL